MLPLTDEQGRIYVAPAQVPTFLHAGIGYTPSGQMCTWTTPNTDDRFIGGWRVRNNGQVIVADASPPHVFNEGLPFSKLDGSLIRQTDVTPAPTDPYVAGIRVGPLGGVYFTTAIPPARLVTAAMQALKRIRSRNSLST
jgi:hypothetical protein